MPFNGHDDKEIFAQIKSCKYDLDNDTWKNISEEAKDLIKHILVPESERYSAKEVLAHPWFNIIKNNKEEQNLNIDFNFFKKYSEENALKKIVLYFIATRLNEKEIHELNDLFKSFDKNCDGQISYEEFENGFFEFKNKCNTNIFNDKDIKHIFNMVDVNKNGMIDYSEFIAATLVGREEIVQKRLLDAFNTFDTEQTGKIKREDFIKALHIDNSLKEKGFEKMIDDLTKDGLIDYNEFMKLLKQ